MELCPHCASYVKETVEICPTCHRNTKEKNTVDALRPETMLITRYRILDKLWQEKFAIIYEAVDTRTKALVLIKEFFYFDYCRRDAKYDTVLVSENEKNILDFKKTKKRALKKSRLHTVNITPYIIHAYEFFESNNTVYTVLEYIKMENLYTIIKREAYLSEEVALHYFIDLIKALQVIHTSGCVHGSINLQNIFINQNNDLKLFDFGTPSDIDKNHNEITDHPSQAFLHLEESPKHSNLPLYYDIYAAGIILYGMLSGDIDDISTDINTQNADNLSIKIEHMSISNKLKKVLLNCISIESDKKYRTTEEILSLFQNVHTDDISNEAKRQNKVNTPTGINVTGRNLVLFLIPVLAAIYFMFFMKQTSPLFDSKSFIGSVATHRSEQPTQESGNKKQEIITSNIPSGNTEKKYIESYRSASDLHLRMKQYGKAFQNTQKACTGGEISECYKLGWMYEYGKGTTINSKMAASLYRKSCKGGNMMGCKSLGVLYENGKGIVKNLHKAAMLYRKSCNGGNMMGCNNLGWIYQHGKGVTRNRKKAISLYKKACNGGNITACRNLGILSPSDKSIPHS